MAAHLGAEEAQHGARKLERHVAHPGAWIPFLEPWQLILEQRRLKMEPGSSKAMWRLIQEQWSISSSPWSRGGSINMEPVSSKAMEVHPGAMAAHLGAEKAQYGIRPEARCHMEVHPGALEAFREPWQFTLEHWRLIVEPGIS
jgi:hypothetical protein